MGLLVGVNHFIDPSWPILPTRSSDGIEFSRLRHNDLLALAEENKRKIDDLRMMSILDVSIEDGGATSRDKCLYQFVAVPEAKRWRIEAPGRFEWTRINLDLLFR